MRRVYRVGMDEVTRAIERAGRWLALGRAASAFVLLVAISVGALTVALIAQRVFAFPAPWGLVWMGALGLSAVIAAGWSWAQRPSALGVARAVDERAGLRETLSTAVCVRGQGDAWSVAAQEDAARLARGLVVRREFPIRAPRLWWAPLAAACAFTIVWWAMPRFDVLGAGARLSAAKTDLVEAQRVASEVAEDKAKLDSMLAGVEGATAGEAEPTEPAQGLASAEDIRRAAVKRLTDVKDRLADIRAGEKGVKLDSLREMMRDLRRPGPGPLDDAVKALQQGDFAGAKTALDALSEQAAAGGLREDQQKRLKEQALDIAAQLARLAEQRKDLERALEEKGLDKGLASNLEGLDKALQNADGLTEEQKQSLRDMAGGAAGANQQAKELSKALSRIGESGAGAMGEAGEQLSAMEMLQEQMDGADAAQREALAQLDKLGQGMGQGQAMDLLRKYDRTGMGKKQGEWSAKQGEGSGAGEQQGGGRGQGSGAEGNLEESAHKTEKSKAKSPNQGGPIIGTMLVHGEQVRGESRAALTEAVAAAGVAATEAIETNRVPREYEAAIKRYFGRLEAKTKAAPVSAPTPPGAPGTTAPPAPAAGAPAPAPAQPPPAQTPPPATPQ